MKTSSICCCNGKEFFFYIQRNCKEIIKDKIDKFDIVNTDQQIEQCFKMREGLKLYSVFMFQNKAGWKNKDKIKWWSILTWPFVHNQAVYSETVRGYKKNIKKKEYRIMAIRLSFVCVSYQ